MSVSFKREWPILHLSSLLLPLFIGGRKEASRKLSFEWKILIWIGHESCHTTVQVPTSTSVQTLKFPCSEMHRDEKELLSSYEILRRMLPFEVGFVFWLKRILKEKSMIIISKTGKILHFLKYWKNCLTGWSSWHNGNGSWESPVVPYLKSSLL